MLTIVFVLLTLAALGAALWLWKTGPAADRFRRLITALLPLTIYWIAAQCSTAILESTQFIWNDVRLARSVSLLHGYHLYYGPAADGPIIGTLHAPLTHLIYAPLGYLRNPAHALLAGSLLSFLMLFAPFAWIHLKGIRALPGLLFPAMVLLACGFVILESPALRYCAFNIHTDAGALGFGGFAAGVLYRNPRRKWLSASCALLAIGCKQTMAPLLVALPLFVWITEGLAAGMRYTLYLLGAGALLTGLIAAIFWPPAALWFNVWTLASAMPPRPDRWAAMLETGLALRSETLLVLLPVVFLALNSLLFATGERAQGGWREWMTRERWTVFLLVGVCMLPVVLLARATDGGSLNHLALFSYFAVLATGTALSQHASPPVAPASVASKIFVVILIVFNLGPFALPRLLSAWRNRDNSPSVVAYRFSKAHPAAVYFPWNPLAALSTEGKLYHFDYSVYDRELRGYALPPDRFNAQIPKSFQAVAIPPSEVPTSRAIQDLIRDAHPVNLADLPGWKVFAVDRPR